LVPFSPLGKDFLTGTVDTTTRFEQGNDIRATIPRSTQHNDEPRRCPVVGIAVRQSRPCFQQRLRRAVDAPLTRRERGS
jgi:hypothetical protein